MWDLQLDKIMSKAYSRLYIIRTCIYYGFSRKELDLLFHNLILPILVFGVGVWGCASFSYKYGYLIHQLSIVDILNNKDRVLWEKITADPNHALQLLLPPSRQLELRDRELPRVRAERFKRVFVNRCLFNFI